MKRFVIPVMFTTLLAAAKPSYFGTYRGTMGEFTLESRGGKAHLDFGVGLPGCSGAIEGDGAIKDNVFTYTTKVEGQEEPCTLTITFSGKSAASVESEHCGYFHGASCEFDGEYKRVKKAK